MPVWIADVVKRDIRDWPYIELLTIYFFPSLLFRVKLFRTRQKILWRIGDFNYRRLAKYVAPSRIDSFHARTFFWRHSIYNEYRYVYRNFNLSLYLSTACRKFVVVLQHGRFNVTWKHSIKLWWNHCHYTLLIRICAAKRNLFSKHLKKSN